MQAIRNVSDAIFWVGANDRRLALFENLFPIPRGVSYNSYLIRDERTCLMDTVDASVRQQFLENVSAALGGRALDYLVIDHMEPDHCANIGELMERYPGMKLVGNEKTFRLIRQFYALPLGGRILEVREGDVLALGAHTLRFIEAPMVHWPEVLMTYEASEGVLFSADAFGSFGALDGRLFSDELDFRRDWLDDARRYYANIVGKYGAQVRAALAKASALDIRAICPLHGPVWRADIPWLLEKYSRWSRWEPEEQAVAVFYGSMYGNTAAAADALAARLARAGVRDITVRDVSSAHVSWLIADAFRCSHLALAAPTYNMGLYPAMEALLRDMRALNLQNRTVALIENGSWACAAGKIMRGLLGEMKNMRVLPDSLTLTSSLRGEQRGELERLCDTIVRSLGEERAGE